MQKKVTIYIKTSLTFTLIVVAVGCAVKSNPLVGTWRYEEGDRWEEITFYSDMTYSVLRYVPGPGPSSGSGTYSYTRTTFTQTVENISVICDYKIRGFNLYITFSDYTLTYVKKLVIDYILI